MKSKIEQIFLKIYHFFYELFAPEKFKWYLIKKVGEYESRAIFEGVSLPRDHNMSSQPHTPTEIEWYLNYDIKIVDLNGNKEDISELFKKEKKKRNDKNGSKYRKR